MKLEQAARQAIKDLHYAIEEMRNHASRVGPQHSWWDVTCDFDTTAKALEEALAKQAEQEPVACGCGATAYCLIRHTNLPEHNFTPICLSCLQEHEQNAQEVNEHEMHNFGGAYGLVTWETKPLYTAPVHTKDLTDDEIMDLVRDECVDMRWPSTPLFIARAVIAKFKEKNR